jgi:hypothetical protein
MNNITSELMFPKCLCFVVHRMRSGLDLGSGDATPQNKKLRIPLLKKYKYPEKSETRRRINHRQMVFPPNADGSVGHRMVRCHIVDCLMYQWLVANDWYTWHRGGSTTGRPSARTRQSGE